MKVLSNQQYADNAKRTSQLFRDQKETPLERAIWWIEWILRNPNTDHFRSLASDMNIFQMLSIDVIFVIAVISFGLVWITFKIVFGIWKLFKGSKKNDGRDIIKKKKKKE